MPIPPEVWTEGRYVLDEAPPLDGDRYTLDGVARGIGISAIHPTKYVIGDPSTQIVVYGYGFTPDSVINFAGNDERTDYIGSQVLNTFLEGDLWTNPDPAVPLKVTDPDNGESNTVTFAIVAA